MRTRSRLLRDPQATELGPLRSVPDRAQGDAQSEATIAVTRPTDAPREETAGTVAAERQRRPHKDGPGAVLRLRGVAEAQSRAEVLLGGRVDAFEGTEVVTLVRNSADRSSGSAEAVRPTIVVNVKGLVALPAGGGIPCEIPPRRPSRYLRRRAMTPAGSLKLKLPRPYPVPSDFARDRGRMNRNSRATSAVLIPELTSSTAVSR